MNVVMPQLGETVAEGTIASWFKKVGDTVAMPVIHAPNVAILSFDAVRKARVVVEGPKGDSVAIRRVAMIGQSFDHRAFDGAYAAGLLRRL